MHRNKFAAPEVLPQPWRRRVLWVDDSRLLLSLYKSVFENLGFEVQARPSPEEALHHLSSGATDVAILDYDMPEMDGGKLALLIKAQSPTLPVILYTGSTCVPHSVRYCVDAVCAKGAPREQLVAVIERLTRESAYEPFSAGPLASLPESTMTQQA